MTTRRCRVSWIVITRSSLSGEHADDLVSASEHLKLAFFKLPVIQLNSKTAQLRADRRARATGVRRAQTGRRFPQPDQAGQFRRNPLGDACARSIHGNNAYGDGHANANGVQALFVWQPVPLWKYDLRLRLFELQPSHQLPRVGYPLMYDRYQRGSPPSNFAWCADVQEGSSETLYIDQVHYRPLLALLVRIALVRKLLSNDGMKKLGWSRVSSDSVVPEMAGH